ncbi:MAG TPA: hypothetical protein VNB49_17980 [Candidatus Dormibacteraeota bacterium]|nr:hypothetical protein [Candidatus Dormibacteraeota bacterium]
MRSRAKQRAFKALLIACGLPVIVLASRSFYFQELFFAFLLFAGVFLILLVIAGLAVALWVLCAQAMVYLATRTATQGPQALPLSRAIVLCLAPMVIKTAGAVAGAQQVLLYPLGGRVRSWLRSFRLDASHFREDAERAVKQLRLMLKQS